MIMTSNIGADLIKGGVTPFGLQGRKSGTAEEQGYNKMNETLMKEIERYIRPEFIGRLDDVIVFRPLGVEHLKLIIELELNKVTKRLVDHGLTIELHDDAKEFLIEKGTNADFGARPLRRAIEQFVEDPLSEDILRGAYKDKDTIVISRAKDDEGASKDHLHFDARKTRRPEQEPVAAAQSADAT
jgi:ATP-dependent Clp protease ATP-binding subunit ClpC